ncbi:unnamed protein product [Natator depressus]
MDRPFWKLDYQFFGLYQIQQQISWVTFKLQLPQSLEPPIFHFSLLKPCTENAFHSTAPLVQAQCQEEYVVHRVLDSKIKQGKLWYLIDWKGDSPEERTWEPAENVPTPTPPRPQVPNLINLDPPCLECT